MRYIPNFYKETNDILVLDSTLSSNECLDYAIIHNMNVRYEETTSTGSVRVIMDFINKGFKPEFTEEKQVFQGLNLGDKVVINFIKQNQ